MKRHVAYTAIVVFVLTVIIGGLLSGAIIAGNTQVPGYAETNGTISQLDIGQYVPPISSVWVNYSFEYVVSGIKYSQNAFDGQVGQYYVQNYYEKYFAPVGRYVPVVYLVENACYGWIGARPYYFGTSFLLGCAVAVCAIFALFAIPVSCAVFKEREERERNLAENERLLNEHLVRA